MPRPFIWRPVLSEIIYGAGGHGRELAFQLIEHGRPVVAHVDDFHSDRLERDIPVLSYRDALRRYPSATWHIAIGDIPVREKLLAKVRADGLAVGGFASAQSIIAPSAVIAESAQIFGNCVVSDSCRLADDVIVNFGCVLSHDAHIERGSIICPRVAVAGNVRIGKGVWLGVGCTVSNGSPTNPLIIEDGAYIGAGACIISNIARNKVVYGVPGRMIREQQS